MWFTGGGDAEQTKGADQPDSLQAIDQREKARLVTAIDSNKYVRRNGQWKFRTGLGLRDYLLRGGLLLVIFLVAFLSNPRTPRGREDKDWLISFSIVMMIWITAVHAIAYLPSMIFGGFKEMREALFGRVAHAYSNWRDYQYVAAIIVIIVVLYPFMLFFYLIWDGFNPYDNLSTQETRLEGGLQARLCYVFRILFHLFMLVLTAYLFIAMLLVAFIRHRQPKMGQYFWVA